MDKYIDRAMSLMEETNNQLADFAGISEYVEKSISNKMVKGSVIQQLVGEEDRFRIKLKTENKKASDIDPGMTAKIDAVSEALADAFIMRFSSNFFNFKRQVIKALREDLKFTEGFEIEFFNSEKTIKIQKGSSLIKGVNRLAKEAYKESPTKDQEKLNKDLLETLDKTVAYKSKIDQASLVGGSFFLSADPIDFLTMSTNNSNWSSCYSIKKDRPDSHSGGGQEQTAVSLGVGADSMLLYIEDENNMMGQDRSKLLRAIVYLNQDVFSIGYFYPYEISQETINDLNEEIAQLLLEKTGIVYKKADKNIKLSTFPSYDSLYCDIYQSGMPDHPVYLSREIKRDWIDIRPFGDGVCLSCGERHVRETIYCEECLGYRYCFECGSYESLNMFDGDYEICRACMEESDYWDEGEL